MTRIFANFTEFKGTKLHFRISGNGPVIVLLHGFLESSEIWKNFTRRLSNSFKVITIDLPGHGLSELPEKGNNIDEMAQAVHAVLKSLHISICIMAGHSLGGYITLAFAGKYPRMLKGFVLFHSHAAADSPEARISRDRTIAIVQKDHQGFIRNFIPGLFDPDNVKKFGTEIENLKELAQKTPKEGIIAALEAMKNRPDRQHVLQQSKVPVFFIIGKKDPKIPIEVIVPQTLLPDHSEVLLLDHVGHMGFIEASDVTFKALQGFAERVLK
jgi:pimeloyl-ACP methyl ester carboxylesterase